MPTVTRADVVAEAMKFDGRDNGHGYDCSNPFSADLGHPKEAWCGDYVTDMFKRVGAPLVPMQSGCSTGYAGCPEGWEFAKAHKATKHSWEALPADPVIFHWPGGDVEGDHTGLVVYWRDGVLRVISGNSGPSNVNSFKGVGGVHLSDWACPAGKGNSEILGVIDAAKVSDVESATQTVKLHLPAAQPALVHEPRKLLLKSPRLHGGDVHALQEQLNKHPKLIGHQLTVNGTYDKATAAAVDAVQKTYQDPFGVAGMHTLKHLHLPH